MKKLTKVIVSLTMLLALTFSLTACDKKTTVVFDAQGGVVSTITAKLKNNENYSLPIPIKDGYTFVCWLNGDKEVPNNGVWLNEASNVTLKAQWRVKNYSVEFDANGGELDATNLAVDYDEVVTLPIPTRRGYTFKGWKYKDKTVSDGAWKINGENIKLVADWKIIDYTVTFKLNGGQFTGKFVNMETYTVNYGKDYDFEQFAPVKGNHEYEFLRWVLEDDGTEVKVTGKWSYDRNVTLVAVWKNFYGPSV